MKKTNSFTRTRTPVRKIVLMGLMGQSVLAMAAAGGCTAEVVDSDEESMGQLSSPLKDATTTTYKCTIKCAGDDKSVEYSTCSKSSDEAEKDDDAQKTACKDHGGFGSDVSCSNTGNKC